MLRATAGLFVAAVLSGAAAGPSPDRDPSRLRPGLFLYAAPGITDSRFAESVVLLIQHRPEGSMGLVVNRPTDMPLREALVAVEEAKGSDLRVHWGGPVRPEAILALVRAPSASPGAQVVLDGVHLTGDLADVRAALSGPDPAGRLRVFTGCAGWTAGQLATEVRAGVWVMDRADAGSVFAPDPSTLWERVHQLLKRLEVRSDGRHWGGRRTETVTFAVGGPSARRRAARRASVPARDSGTRTWRTTSAGAEAIAVRSSPSRPETGELLATSCTRIGRAGSGRNSQAKRRPPGPPVPIAAITNPLASSLSAKDVRSTEPA